MAKIAFFVRQLMLTDQTKELLDKKIIEDTKVTPGQLRKKGEWYFLTFLRIVKIKNFDAIAWDLVDTEKDCIRATSFRVQGNKLIVAGSKGDLKEVSSYFEALALGLAADSKEEIVDFNKFYNIDKLEIDFESILKKLEDDENVAEINKLRVKPMEVSLGRVNNCVINTSDYGGARKAIAEDNAFGLEISLKKPEKTSVYFDLDGQIRVNTQSDVELEDLALEFINLS